MSNDFTCKVKLMHILNFSKAVLGISLEIPFIRTDLECFEILKLLKVTLQFVYSTLISTHSSLIFNFESIEC